MEESARLGPMERATKFRVDGDIGGVVKVSQEEVTSRRVIAEHEGPEIEGNVAMVSVSAQLQGNRPVGFAWGDVQMGRPLMGLPNSRQGPPYSP